MLLLGFGQESAATSLNLVMDSFRKELHKVQQKQRLLTEQRQGLASNQAKMQERLDEHYLILAERQTDVAEARRVRRYVTDGACNVGTARQTVEHRPSCRSRCTEMCREGSEDFGALFASTCVVVFIVGVSRTSVNNLSRFEKFIGTLIFSSISFVL